jgi:uncharacterized protein (TIGR03437 family)
VSTRSRICGIEEEFMTKANLLAATAAVALALFPGGFPLSAQPAITMVQNNYSYILPGLPNYGIAPGALMLIQGTGLTAPGSQAYPLQNPSNELPTTLNESSVSVTVGNTTVHPALYYTCNAAVCGTPYDLIAAVLPSSTPLGTLAQVTVTYNSVTSQPYNTMVIQSAFGFDTYYGTGSGMAAVTDNLTGSLISPTNSAHPGETIVFWGAGVGADTKNNDRDPPTDFTPLNYITQLFIGGQAVPIAYQGRSHYQGVDQIDVTLPQGVPTGCAVSVTAVSGSGASAVVSNTVTIPISSNGGACSDTLQPIGAAAMSSLAGHPLVNFGSLNLSQVTNTTGVVRTASAQFTSIVGTSLWPYLSNTLPSLGSCVVYQQFGTAPVNPFQLQGLSPGTISVTGTGGTKALNTVPAGPGLYTGDLTAGLLQPGSFTFAGQGGTDVQPFNAQVNFPNASSWTNQSAATTITRSQGFPVTWTGGDSDTYIQISGSATAGATAGLTEPTTVFFTCDAPVGPGSFTIPPAVLMALPAAGGNITVGNYTYPASFSASGLDFAYAVSNVSVFVPNLYQ